jgi:prolyl-tRNA synthetase
MRYSRMFIPTAKEAPKDAVIQSHILMIRAGLIKKVSSGIYSLLPLGYRTVKKVEHIIREEMDRIGGNEFYLPVLIPGELWKTSRRWYDMGQELFRLTDRGEQDYVLAPTHEEVFTYILKDHLKSYRDLPLTVYQIGLKFRDEIRPRFGVMRVKTFIMKDAYSFHPEKDDDSLHKTYSDMSGAYRRIFLRCGLDTIPVAADSGAMGGSQSEEFMVPAMIGEEEIVHCASCGYVANKEKATCSPEETSYEDTGELELIETPNVKTITDLSDFLKIGPDRLIKTLCYKTSGGEYVLALIRGDLEVHETKLKNYLGVSDIEKTGEEEAFSQLKIPMGFAGPVGVRGARIVADKSVGMIKGGVTGANRVDYHYKNVNAGRDFEPEKYIDIRVVGEGDSCPECGGKLSSFRGIELGHIFKLGDKYSRAFGVTYLDEEGTSKVPLMGCYGIGVERTVAAVIEQNHDKYGIKWPMSVSPFHVHILPVKYEGALKEATDLLYTELSESGVEVLLDDREERAGIKFNDADLIGIPFRVTIGGKSLGEGEVELKMRASGESKRIKLQKAASVLRDMVRAELDKYSVDGQYEGEAQ